MEDSVEDVLVGVMVVVVVIATVIIGGKIIVVEIVNDNYLMEVEVVEEECLMNDSARFDTYHLDLNRRS